MTSKQKIVRFEGSNGDVTVDRMNTWLHMNPKCKVTNITNVDTTGRWTILAIAECSKSEKSHKQVSCSDNEKHQ